MLSMQFNGASCLPSSFVPDEIQNAAFEAVSSYEEIINSAIYDEFGSRTGQKLTFRGDEGIVGRCFTTGKTQWKRNAKNESRFEKEIDGLAC